MKFTDSYIRNLKPTEKKYYKREDNGFTIRVLPTGVKTFLFVYTFDGRRREMNLGIYDNVKLGDARSAYSAAYSILHDKANPRDPQEERDRQQDEAREKREERRNASTVADLVDEYIDKHAKKFKRSWQDDERLLRKELLNEERKKGATVWSKRSAKDATDWGNRKAADITKRDMTLLLESIVDRGTPAMSNQVLKVVRKMFNFAVERDILKHTPCTGVKTLAPNTRRERTLSENEIKTLWGSMGSAVISDGMERALKLVLVTAQRPGEVAGMHTDEIDGHWWTIPAERSKNGKEHRVYLTNTALEVINAAIEDNQQSLINHNLRMKKEKKTEVQITDPYNGFIFPCPHKDKVQAIDSHALPVSVRRNLAWPLTDAKGKPLYQKDGKPATENKLKVEQFTPHDLRRTAATFMGGMGFMDEIIDAVLNHVKQGIIRTYNRHGYDKEKQQALEAWERKLNSIITATESKVISIQRKSA